MPLALALALAGCVGGSSPPAASSGGFGAGNIFSSDAPDTLNDAQVGSETTSGDAVGLQDAVSLDTEVGGDAAMSAADAAVAGAPDGQGCVLGATRCATGERQICSLKGWSPNPCEAIAPSCVAGKCLACAPKSKFCAATPPGSTYSDKVMLCDETGSTSIITAHCAEGPCKEGVCMACLAGQHRCHKGKREVCAGGGLLWAPNHCPAAQPLCTQGNCVTCLPNEKFCGKDGAGIDAVVVCDASGSKGTMVQVCSGNTFCHSGACVACKPGDASCKDGLLVTCKADGSGYTFSACPSATPACVAGGCKLCEANQVHCRLATATLPAAVMTCGSNGDTATAIKACDAGHLCHEKACKACAPATAICLGNTPLVCAADGASSTAAQSCSKSGLLCGTTGCLCDAGLSFCAAPAAGLAAGNSVWLCDQIGKTASKLAVCKPEQICLTGKCVTCNPGAKRCEDNKALFCKADGSGWQVDTDCSTKALTCVAGACQDLCALTDGNETNLGCRFWAVDLDNAKLAGTGSSLDAQNAPYGVILVNGSSKSAAVTITFGPGPNVPIAKTHKVTVPAGKASSVVLPPPSWGLKPASQNDTSLQGLAFRVDATTPIAVFQHNPLQSNAFSADASMLLPANALGTAHRVVIRKQSLADLRGYMAIVATRPGTTKVVITSTATTLAGGAVPGLLPGKPQQIAVQQGQVLNIETAKIGDDLSGSLITSDKPIAVFAGAEAAHAPDTDTCIANPGAGKTCAGTQKACLIDGDCPQTCCADHLEEQLPPLTAWGTTHIAGRLKPRGNEQDTWRVVAAHNGTKVVVTPPVVALKTLQAGEWFEVSATKGLIFESTKPVLVAQYMASSGLTGKSLGDPALVILPSVAAMGREASFWVPNTYASNFVTVTFPTGAQVKLDNKVQATGAAIAGTGWSSTQLAVSAGFHKIVASAPFAGVLHGWSKDGSYAHSVGHTGH